MQERFDLPGFLVGGLELLFLRPQPLLRPRDLAGVALAQQPAFGRPLAGKFLAAFAGAQAVTAFLRGVAGLLESCGEVLERRARRGEPPVARADLVLGLRVGAAEARQVLLRGGEIVCQAPVEFVREVRVEQAQVRRERAVAAGLGGLALERLELALDFRDHVGQPREVAVGLCELARGFPPLGLVLRDAGRLLENRAPVLGPGREDQVDPALLHDGIGRAAHAGVHEQFLDVAQAAGGLVEEVFAPAVAEHAPGDGHLVERRAELRLAVREGQRHLRHAERLAGVRAVEDHVGHLAAAQGLGGLLPQGPADGVQHVALAAAVGPHHGGHPLREIQLGFMGEGLEAQDFQAAQIHGGRNGRLLSKAQLSGCEKRKVQRRRAATADVFSPEPPFPYLP